MQDDVMIPLILCERKVNEWICSNPKYLNLWVGYTYARVFNNNNSRKMGADVTSQVQRKDKGRMRPSEGQGILYWTSLF